MEVYPLAKKKIYIRTCDECRAAQVKRSKNTGKVVCHDCKLKRTKQRNDELKANKQKDER